jgi:quercetin dioxygenase-like cupin family protein
MKVDSGSELPSRRGPAEWFTGTAWIDEIAVGAEPSRARLYRVAFEPGARTAWHTHPVGQVLHVLSGVGRVQAEGQPVRAIRPGDTVRIAPGERHWHGAAPANTMVHLALQETNAEGVEAVWLEHVTDAEYNAR